MKSQARIAYAVGDAGINLYFISTLSFLLYFYTDIYGISAAVASGVFFVARQIDALTDPLMGYICDRTVSKWGKMRPYLLFGAIPLGLISIAVFTVPDFGEVGKIVWAYVTYTLFGILYTVVTIPYAALTGMLTTDHDERATLSTLRMAGAFTGALIVSSLMLPMATWFGSEDTGFQMVMVIFSIGSTLLIWITFMGTKEQIDIQLCQVFSAKGSSPRGCPYGQPLGAKQKFRAASRFSYRLLHIIHVGEASHRFLRRREIATVGQPFLVRLDR